MSHEPADEEFKQNKIIRERLVYSEDPEESGFDYLDPKTKIRYALCVTCGIAMEQEAGDDHSGGQCNLCHAISKDD